MDTKLEGVGLTKKIKPSLNLFDRIISAIKQEKEFKQTKKILIAFILLLVVSVATAPFSATFFLDQWNSSKTDYFISLSISNINMFFAYWQDFALSIFESLPIVAIILLALNIASLLFTLRLFLYKKGYLIRYLRYKIT